MEKYDDIINLPHHISKKHPRLSIEQRAAQFAPFASLTGFENLIKETSRITDNRIELEEEQITIINTEINKIEKRLKNSNPKVKIVYFIPDLKKSGGKYVTIVDKIKKIDKYNRCLIMSKNNISMNDIIKIELL